MLRPRGDGTAADRYDRAGDTSVRHPRGRQRLGREPGRPRLRHAVPVGHADVPVPHADPDAHPDVRVPQHAAAYSAADTDADADVHLSYADPDADADMYLHADADAD